MNGKLFLCAAAFLILTGCKKESLESLPPYEPRPLSIVRVTQNSSPDIQWLGGRIMAVGINRGQSAGLDSTLVWLTTSGGNTIFNYVTMGINTDSAGITACGGRLADSLDSDSIYTFWVAEQGAYAARIDRSNATVNALTFVDSSMAARYLVKGTSDGEGGPTTPIAKISLRRYETINGDRFVMKWTPSTTAFRLLAIRVGPSGGYDNLLWQISTPTGVADNILPPVIVGVVPGNMNEPTAWTPTSFNDQPTYTIWMANRNWAGPGTGGVFQLRARGYVWFRFAHL